MENKNSKMIPIMTTQAGSCLTVANWKAAGVGTASFYLTALLMKPGFEFLKKRPGLASYVGWHETLVLNASTLHQTSDGRYSLRSEYDGSQLYYTTEDIISLITTLKPNMVILPQGISQHWLALPTTIFPFLPMTDLPMDAITKPHGVYISSPKDVSFEDYNVPCYMSNVSSLAMMKDLIKKGVNFVESNAPANDAYNGDVYTSKGLISLTSASTALNFDVIDKNCTCPVCHEKLTQAYLHHLLQHTPLLCQRYLVQHNLHYCCHN